MFSVKTVCAREYVDNVVKPVAAKANQAFTIISRDVPLTGLTWSRAGEHQKIDISKYLPANTVAIMTRFPGNDNLYLNNYYISPTEKWMVLYSKATITKTNYPCSLICFVAL